MLARRAEGRPTTLAGLLDETYTDGFIVMRDGAVAYERYFNGMMPRTLHLCDQLPRNAMGKVQKKVLTESVAARASST